MKKTIRLSAKELKVLAQQIDQKFRQYEGGSPEIKWNSYLGNYELLAESIFRVTSQLGCPKNIGSRPLRDMLYYSLSDKCYQLYLIDACYLYIYGTTRQEYLEGSSPCKYQMGIPLMTTMFEVACKLYEHGNAKEAKEILQPLFYNAKKYNLAKKNLKLYAEVCLTFGKVKMQLGDKEKNGNTLNLALCALEAFLELKELKGITESYQLLGIVHRQLEQFSTAIQYYQKVLELTKNESPLAYRKYHTLHDLAVSHFLQAEQTGDKRSFNHSLDAFKISNNYFLQQEPDFYPIASIRLAESYIKQDQLQYADQLLETFEDASELVKLQLPHQMLFFRINAERYFKSGNIEKAIKYLKTGIQFSQREAYQHQTELCNKLCEMYKKFLPDRSNFLNT